MCAAVRLRDEITSMHRSRKGTLGFLVEQNGRRKILTCEHVLWYKHRAPATGDRALTRRSRRPGLLKWILMSKSKKWKNTGYISSVSSKQADDGLNFTDSALFNPNNTKLCRPTKAVLEALRPYAPDTNEILYDSQPVSYTEALVSRMWVAKEGAATGVTVGRVPRLNSKAVKIRGSTHLPEMVIPKYIRIAGNNAKFCDTGDSGAAVWCLKGNRVRPLAMICGTYPGYYAAAVPITRILQLHQAQVVTAS